MSLKKIKSKVGNYIKINVIISKIMDIYIEVREKLLMVIHGISMKMVLLQILLLQLKRQLLVLSTKLLMIRLVKLIMLLSYQKLKLV